MIPDAPTNAPATIKMILFTINPAAIAAIPDKEFKNAITTGISAPPINITLVMPSSSERMMMYSVEKSIFVTNNATTQTSNTPDNKLISMALKLFNFPRNLATAIKLPENVKTPTVIENTATEKSESIKLLFEIST